MKTTHIEVVSANDAKNLGIKKGDLLKVVHETNYHFMVESHTGRKIKISKHTKRIWGFKGKSAVFNI